MINRERPPRDVDSDPQRLLEPVRQFLAAPRCAVLSSVGADGAPHQVVVHYRPGRADLLVNGRADRLWVTNLTRDGRVSLVVHDAEDAQHWVGVRGAAERLRDGQPAVEDAMDLARRYGEDPSQFEGLQRVSFRIVPHRVFEYGATGPGLPKSAAD